MVDCTNKRKGLDDRGLRKRCKTQHPATSLVSRQGESVVKLLLLGACPRINSQKARFTGSVDPTGFEPASATFAGCCVSVTPRARARLYNLRHEKTCSFVTTPEKNMAQNGKQSERNMGYKYFWRINFRRSRVAAGINLLSVKTACASADPHLQLRSFGMAATASRTTLHAFSAFFTRTATI
jgi:hypothetical protein